MQEHAGGAVDSAANHVPLRGSQSLELLTPEDTFWNIVGMIDDEGPTTVSATKHEYLARSHTSKTT